MRLAFADVSSSCPAQVEVMLRQQLDERVKALAQADQKFAHLEGVMRRLAASAVPLS
jgi:hypothetical protein